MPTPALEIQPKSSHKSKSPKSWPKSKTKTTVTKTPLRSGPVDMMVASQPADDLWGAAQRLRDFAKGRPSGASDQARVVAEPSTPVKESASTSREPLRRAKPALRADAIEASRAAHLADLRQKGMHEQRVRYEGQKSLPQTVESLEPDITRGRQQTPEPERGSTKTPKLARLAPLLTVAGGVLGAVAIGQGIQQIKNGNLGDGLLNTGGGLGGNAEAAAATGKALGVTKLAKLAKGGRVLGSVAGGLGAVWSGVKAGRAALVGDEVSATENGMDAVAGAALLSPHTAPSGVLYLGTRALMSHQFGEQTGDQAVTELMLNTRSEVKTARRADQRRTWKARGFLSLGDAGTARVWLRRSTRGDTAETIVGLRELQKSADPVTAQKARNALSFLRRQRGQG